MGSAEQPAAETGRPGGAAERSCRCRRRGHPEHADGVGGVGANLLIAAAKSVAAMLTGSASMVAESAHSWADTGNESSC